MLIRIRYFGTAMLALAVAAESSVSADRDATDPTISYLINAPTTLMDKGVFEIQRKIEASNSHPYWILNRPPSLGDNALHEYVYVWPEQIAVHLYVYPPKPVIDGKSACAELIRYAEDILGFQSGDGRPKYMAESLADLFGHYSYMPEAHPTNLGNRLMGLFAIQGGVIPNNGEKHYCHSIGGAPIRVGQLPSTIRLREKFREQDKVDPAKM